MGLLADLDQVIQDRIRIPVSLEALLESDPLVAYIHGQLHSVWEHSESVEALPKMSVAACVEAIECRVEAFQLATDATEHSLSAEICAYANVIATKKNAHLRHYLMELIHEYIQNRTYVFAVKELWSGSLEEGHRFWSSVRRSSLLVHPEIMNFEVFLNFVKSKL